MKLLGYSIYPHMTQLSNTESASKELPADLHLSPPESNKKIHNEPWDNVWRWFVFFEPGWNFRNMFGIPYQVPRFLGCASYSKGLLRLLRLLIQKTSSPLLVALPWPTHGTCALNTAPWAPAPTICNTRTWRPWQSATWNWGFPRLQHLQCLHPIGIQEFGCHFAWCISNNSLEDWWKSLWTCDSVVPWVLSTHFTSLQHWWPLAEVENPGPAANSNRSIWSRLMDMGHMGVLLVDLYQLFNNSIAIT